MDRQVWADGYSWMDIGRWIYRDGQMDINRWIWIDGCGHMNMPGWIWVDGYRQMNMDSGQNLDCSIDNWRFLDGGTCQAFAMKKYKGYQAQILKLSL